MTIALAHFSDQITWHNLQNRKPPQNRARHYLWWW